MIGEKYKRVDFETVAVAAEGASKPTLYDPRDSSCGFQEKHFVLRAVRNKMNGVWKMHTVC